MITPRAYLKNNTLSRDIDTAAPRDGYGIGLLEVGEKNESIVVLCADVADSTRSAKFREKYPKRFIQAGIAEQNMVGVATGLALQGKVPFVSTYAVFCPGRTWDQVRVSVCYNRANVKIAGAHAGFSAGPDGATHQALEDIAITRALPGLIVLAPSDAEETRKAVHLAAEINGPVYFRYSRNPAPLFTTPQTPFKVGKATIFHEGTDVAIIGAGPIIHTALLAADRLIERGVSVCVVNSPSIKPLDEDTIEKVARQCGAVVTVEEHQIHGGLGSAVAETLGQRYPVPLEMVGMPDMFGESGEPEQLRAKYRLSLESIVNAVQRVRKRK